MKKLITLLLVIVFSISMVFIAIGCKEEAVPEGETAEEAASAEETAEETTEEAAPAEEKVVAEDELFISVVCHADVSNPYQIVVGNGVKQAAIDFGVEAEYVGPSQIDAVAQNALIDGAIAKGADGISTVMIDPDGVGPKIKEVVEMGIPVMFHQGGDTHWQELGAICFIGGIAYDEGYLTAKTLIDEYGCKNILYDNHVPGNVTIETRWEGFKDAADEAGVKATMVVTDVYDQENTEAAYRATWLEDPTYDGISGGWCGMSGLAIVPVLEELDLLDQVTVGIMDYTPEYLALMKEGKVEWTTTGQQYLMGYLSVAFLVNKVRYGVSPIGIITTSPNIIDSSNVDEVLAYIEAGSM